MKNKMMALFFLILLSLILHGYLTNHFYPLHYGMAHEPASCNVGETFNCDAVAASPYSQLFGIPLSVFGILTHIVLLLLVLVGWLRMCDEPKVWFSSALGLSGLSLGASLVMGAISATQLSTYCLVCIALYFVSFFMFVLLLSFKKEFLASAREVLDQGKVPLLIVALIPVGSLLAHQSILSGYGGDKLERALNSFVQSWEQSPASNMDSVGPSFSIGSSDDRPTMVISEFADFRCGHCRDAAPTLHAFTKAHEDEVQLRFFSFPLDGACNALVPGGDGVSCLLAAAVICAEEESKGRKMHDWIFANFESMSRSSGKTAVSERLIEAALQMSLQESAFKTCMESEATGSKIKEQVELGEKVGVQGTPTILVNGKKLPQGQRIRVLERVLKQLRSAR